jgi:prolyl 4-hydroxylase
VERFVMNPVQRIYVVEPAPDDAETLNSKQYKDYLVEMEFRAAYLAEKGVPWLGCYPPQAPTVPIVSMPHEGLGTVVRRVHFREESCASGGPYHADLIALSAGPPQGTQAFLIEDLLTQAECEHIQELSLPHMRRGGVGPGHVAETRTSDTTFLKRDRSPTLDLVHRRMADVLGISDTDLNFVAEHLQVVRYREKQQYSPHFDFSGGNGVDRLATLLVYLQPAEEGGGTSFPKAFPPHGLVVHPKSGSAILFYSKLTDGNLDEMSVHAGMPVIKGTKMVCNLWVRSILPH